VKLREDIREGELRLLLAGDREERTRTIDSIFLLFDVEAMDWKVRINLSNGRTVKSLTLVEKRGAVKGWKSLDRLTANLREWGAQELTVKL
jgi:hypothetical protein